MVMRFGIKIYKTIILLMILYVFGNLTVALSKEYRLRVFENWVVSLTEEG
jgi:hypothetical protein